MVAWAGIRGVATLATALALPLTTSEGGRFPHRDLVIFLAFAVILSTLVLEGLGLPVLIRWLGLQDEGRSGARSPNPAWPLPSGARTPGPTGGRTLGAHGGR